MFFQVGFVGLLIALIITVMKVNEWNSRPGGENSRHANQADDHSPAECNGYDYNPTTYSNNSDSSGFFGGSSSASDFGGSSSSGNDFGGSSDGGSNFGGGGDFGGGGATDSW